jgi:hypothetical protein
MGSLVSIMQVVSEKKRFETLSLTLDHMGEMFQNASSLKPLGQLKPNGREMIIGRFSTRGVFFCRSEILNCFP